MRKLVVLSFILSVFTLSFASPVNELHTLDKSINTENCKQTCEPAELSGSCTVKLNETLADGTTVQGELTFSDVSWWTCKKMQFVAWFSRNF
jgi:hypothetical protein